MKVDPLFHLDIHHVLQAAGEVALDRLAQADPSTRFTMGIALAQSAEIQAVEQVLFEGLKKLTPSAYLISETGRTQGAVSDFRWSICPMDGAMNFLRGRFGFAISMTLSKGGEVCGAWIYDPARQSVAAVGNELPVQVNGFAPRLSRLLTMKGAIMALGGAESRDPDGVTAYWQEVAQAQRWGMTVQRNDCAALDLLDLVSGAVDAVYFESTSYGSIQAGWHIATAARCSVSPIAPGQLLGTQVGILAAQPQIVDELVARWRTNPTLTPV